MHRDMYADEWVCLHTCEYVNLDAWISVCKIRTGTNVYNANLDLFVYLHTYMYRYGCMCMIYGFVLHGQKSACKICMVNNSAIVYIYIYICVCVYTCIFLLVYYIHIYI